MRPTANLALLVLGLLALITADATATEPFRVNTTTAEIQAAPHVAPLALGDFVVVWTSGHSFPPPSGPFDIVGRTFDADGTALRPEFTVNQFGGDNTQARVASDAYGNFVVTWKAYDTVTPRFGVYARRYHSIGAPATGELQLLAGALFSRFDFSMAPSGESVLGWSDYHDSTTIWVRRLDASVSPVGGDIEVASIHDRYDPVLAVYATASGGFVVTWVWWGGTVDTEVHARVFDDTGAPVSGDVTVSESPGSNGTPHVAVNGDGETTIVWWYGAGGHLADRVKMRRLDSAGTPLGPEQLIDDGIGTNAIPDIAMNSAGDFAVLWSTDYEGSPSAWSVRARRFSPCGVALGPSTFVSGFHQPGTTGGSGSLYPDAILKDDQTLIAAWEEDTNETDQVDVYANIVPVGIAITAAAPPPAPALTNRPNPFNPTTTIAYTVRKAGRTTLSIYDAAGRRIRTLLDRPLDPGTYPIPWDGLDASGHPLPSGVYFCRLVTPTTTSTRKLVMIK